MSAVRRNTWVLTSRVAPQVGGVVLLVLGARFLDPTTLGSFVLIFAWIELLRRLVRAGWREAVILDSDAEATPIVMTIAILAAMVALAATGASALALWQLGFDPPFVCATLILGLSLVPVAPGVVWEGLLLRQQRVDLEAATVIAAEAAHLALAAMLLAAGFGILGLALARAARALVGSVGLGWAVGWPFGLSTDWRRAAAVLPVSGHVTLASLINFATTYGVDLIVGFYLGPASVAFYRIGSRIAGGVADVLNETVRVLGWSAIPARQSNETPAETARRIDGFFGNAVVLTAPIFVGLALVSTPLVRVLMGEAWAAAGPIVALLALARLLQIPSIVAWPALATVGRTGILPRLSLAIAGSALVLLLIAGPFGLIAIAASQAVAALLSGGATVVLINRAVFATGHLSLPVDVLCGLAGMAAAVLVAGRLADSSPAASLGLQVAVGAATYAAFLRWRRPGLWLEMVEGLTPVGRPGAARMGGRR